MRRRSSMISALHDEARSAWFAGGAVHSSDRALGCNP
jgi:hypothetical protein